MKNFVLALFVFNILFGCSKDDDTTITIDSKIVGKWQEFEFVDDTYDPENPYDVLGVWEPVDNGTIYKFKSTGELIFWDYNGNHLRTVSFDTKESTVFYYFEDEKMNYQTLYKFDSEGHLSLFQFESVRLKKVGN